MKCTEDNTLKISENVKFVYNLVKQLKSELDGEYDEIESKEKINNIIDKVSDILEKSTEESIINTEEQDIAEKRVLLISSKTQKVILPYTKKQIEKYIEYGKYETEEEVIENEYTFPLSKYKNESISRVIEGYKLARQKSKNSRIDSLKYATNLVFERRLHPAIITACNTIDELDIYLACLDENVLELFDFFDVIFEYPPTDISKNKKIE